MHAVRWPDLLQTTSMVQDALDVVWMRVAGILQQVHTGVKQHASAFKQQEVEDGWMLLAGNNLINLAPGVISSCLTMWDAQTFQGHRNSADSIPIIELSLMFAISWAVQATCTALLLDVSLPALEMVLIDAFADASMEQLPEAGQLWHAFIDCASAKWTTWEQMQLSQAPAPWRDAINGDGSLALHVLELPHICLRHLVGAVVASSGSALIEAKTLQAMNSAWHSVQHGHLPITRDSTLQWVATACSASLQVNHIRVRCLLLCHHPLQTCDSSKEYGQYRT
jgi:hypothetical protein